jgi:hypothetical protein
MVDTPFSVVSDTCGGQAQATADVPAVPRYDDELRMAEASLPAGGSCQLTATILASLLVGPGTYPVIVTAASRD